MTWGSAPSRDGLSMGHSPCRQILVGVLVLLTQSSAARTQAAKPDDAGRSPRAVVQSVSVADIKWTGGFWADRLQTIRDTAQRFGVLIDPHTADGLKVARQHLRPGVPMVVLETALPAKFAETIREALGREPQRPKAMEGIEALPRRFQVMAADTEQVKRYIEARCAT